MQSDTTSPRATVVIPTHNRLPMLQQAVGSVVAQLFDGWQLVVIDDASTDGTQRWLETISHPDVEIVRCERNVERSAARNMGLRQARAPYVLFLDDDDVLRPDGLSRLVSAADACPDAFAAAGARILFDGSHHERRIPWPRWPVVRAPWKEVLAGWIAVPGQTLFRRGLLLEAGGWREGLSVAEDQDVWFRLGYRRPVTIVPEAVMSYRLHGVSRAPANTKAVEREIRDVFVSQLSDRDRPVGRQGIAAWLAIHAANVAFDEHDHRRAARELARAGRAAPWLLRSPVVGPPLTASFCKALAAGALPGDSGLRLERAVKSLRARLGWAPHARIEGGDVIASPRPRAD